MNPQAGEGSHEDRPKNSLTRVVIDDFRSGRIRRGFREDVRELYRFYFSEEERERLRRKPPVGRFFRVAWSLLRALVLRLSPVRRLVLLASLLLMIGGTFDFTVSNAQVRVSMNPFAYALVLIVLLLELKDKLLARDEIAVARQVQLALLPKEQPRLSGWSLWCSTEAKKIKAKKINLLQRSNAAMPPCATRN